MAGHYSSEFKPSLPAFRYKFLATTVGATMWFFIFYRIRKDGAVKLLGHHPWDAHGNGHDEHGHGHDAAHGSHH
ncbi:hypothetical protein WOLCODRAFT_153965 [Wolfiporia cocos MD-104 SS10]|uniref:Uncharacterized protein n=1 Tax=Wolfiporia cocos (strain MD-104) TaxID=742152 RepID=A0A2H3JPT1_WOLCO|nr:hypothetical protein WOLCODRAFT_153965 [Wolfiporia cocos MD-104 SS10]